jgi:hypothetical protein
MGTAWGPGMRWRPHENKDAGRYELQHLHPFQMAVTLQAKGTHAQRDVTVHVSFSLHCFTRARQGEDPPSAEYGDEREVRTFCIERFQLSHGLPDIVRALPGRRCGLAKNNNFLTIDLPKDGLRYGVFFNVRRLKSAGPDAVELVVQSAYALDPDKSLPPSQPVTFATILGKALTGATIAKKR